MNEQRIETLVSGLIDGWLDDAERDALFDLLRRDPHACEVYWRAVGLHHQMVEAAEREGSPVDADQADLVFAELLEHEAHAQTQLADLSGALPRRPEPLRPRPGASRDGMSAGSAGDAGEVFSFGGVTLLRGTQPGGYKLKHLLGFAAGLLLAGLVVAVYVGQPEPQPVAQDAAPARPAIVATLSQSLDARWVAPSSHHAADAPALGEPLRAGAYELADGFVELSMIDGAAVLIQGPSRFTLVDTNTIALETGRLGAEVRGAVKGFAVQTPSGRVTDLGTVFFVDVLSDQTQAYTIEGLITMQRSGESGTSSPAVEIQAGQAGLVGAGTVGVAVIESPDAALIGRSPYVQRHMRDAGVASIDGGVVFREDKSASEVLADPSLNHRIVLIPESRGVVLEEAVMLDSVWPSDQPAWPTRLYIPAGTAVDSFLVIYKSEGFPAESELSMQDGSIQFLRAPFGIQHSNTNLLAFPHGDPRESDAERARLARYQSEVVAPGGAVGSGADALELDPDRKTMRMLFTAQGADAMRVLVPAGSLDRGAWQRSED